VRIAARCGLRPSPDLTMLGKTLLNLDQTTKSLAPDLGVSEGIKAALKSLAR